MGEVLDIMSRLPRSEIGPRVFAAHFIDLRFLQKMSQSIFWGWTSSQGDVLSPIPSELERRLVNGLSRHVAGVAQICIDEDADAWSVAFVASGEEGDTFSYSFEVSTSWGQAQ